MRQAGGSSVPDGARRERSWVDFGVDDRWEAAPPRRLRIVNDSGRAPRAPAGETSGRVAERPRERVAAERPRERVAVERPRRASGPVIEPPPRAPVVMAEPPAEPTEPPLDPDGRRIVTIRGRGAERDLAFPAYRSGRRPATPVHHRPGFKPDRTALWAVMLGLLLVLVAATSAHAAGLRQRAAHAARPAAVAPLIRVAARR